MTEPRPSVVYEVYDRSRPYKKVLSLSPRGAADGCVELMPEPERIFADIPGLTRFVRDLPEYEVAHSLLAGIAVVKRRIRA